MKSQKKYILQGVIARRRGICEDFIAHASKKSPRNFQIETRKKSIESQPNERIRTAE